ncbi:MAG: hypothetical protein GX275_11885 [Clostridiales bacterium]|nr:hypothetical protein [Clostridiales bacterium]
MKNNKRRDGIITSSSIKFSVPNKSFNTGTTNFKDVNDINPDIAPNQKK